jgi:hypothetical protein
MLLFLLALGIQAMEQQHHPDNYRRDQDSTNHSDPHRYCSHGTIAPQSPCGHRNPFNLPLNVLVSISLGSAQNLPPQSGQVSR